MSANISVQVDFYAAIQDVFGQKSTRVTLAEHPTVGGVLEAICTTPERREKVFDSSGQLRRDLTIMRNGRNINFLNGLETVLSQGDVIAVFPPTFGG